MNLDILRNERETRSFDADQVIFQAGEAGDCMYVVLEGQVELSVRGQVLERLGPGGVLGEMALIDREPRSASAITTSDTRLVPIRRDRFDALVQEDPEFSIQLMRVIVGRLRRMDQKI
ncbi:MAG: cyclic nucleotide-binding domain-containing protein [Proteobacteria bacterium]|nr:cyclic nucleotide-binding domain-containing protein [Burkholderiales bacterium]